MKSKLTIFALCCVAFIQIDAQPQKVQLAPSASQTYNEAIAESMQDLPISPFG